MKTLTTKIVLIFIFMSTVGFAQEAVEVRDLETWSSLNLKYKINKKWEAALQGQLRLEDNSAVIDQYFTQLDLEYSPYKNFSFSGALRYVKKNDHTGNVQGYEDYFRYHLDGTYKHKWSDFKFKYRLRYQNKNEIGVDDIAKKYIRFKVGVAYNIKNWKLDPEVSGELYNAIGSDVENELDAYRLTLGTSYKLNDSGKIGLFYRFEKELNTTYPKATNIIGVKYTYSLK